MEFEQIIKRLDWLEEEQRRSKLTLASLEERVGSSDNSLSVLTKRLKTLENNLAALAPAAARVEQFDQIVNNQRSDFTKSLGEIEKKFHRRERDIEKRHQSDIEPVNQSLLELRTTLDKALEMKKDLRTLVEEDARLNQLITELRQKVDDAVHAGEEAQRSIRVAEESRRQDAKRLLDLQGEQSAVRKRVDELREKIEVSSDTYRYIEGKMNELLASESERKQNQAAFLDQQALAQVDRERAWKEIREKYDSFRLQTDALDAQLAELETTHRTLKRAQETHEELNQKIERRINEITEMQRLAEDRIRQEWVTFKADDQKRWTGFSLSQDEALKELHKGIDRVEERMTELEDNAQSLHDQIEQTTDTTERQLEELMNWAHEWLTAYERIMGHTPKSR